MKRFMIIQAMLALFLACTASRAAETDFNEIKFELDTLDNGLQVIYHVDRSAPVVVTVVRYNVGSHDEEPGQTGYAHFFEHLMFEATDAYKRAVLDKYIEEAGGSLNAFTSFDKTVYHIKVPSNEIKLPIWAESRRMRGLHVDSAGVETQRDVVLEEMKMRVENTAYGELINNICALGFPNSSYSWSVIGSANDIRNAKIKDFRNFYNKYYRPNNATLVIAGDINVFQAKEFVEEYFGGLPRGEKIERHYKPVKPLKEAKRVEIIDEKAQLPGVFIGFRAPSLKDSSYYAMSLLTDILASGESSRLYQRLVDKEQIAAQASLVPLSLEKSGTVVFYGVANPGEDIDDVEEIIRDEIKKLADKGITEAELQKAKNIREAQFVSSKKDVLNKAQDLADFNGLWGDPGMINSEIEKYMDLTVKDLNDVARKYLGTDKNYAIVFLPKGYDD